MSFGNGPPGDDAYVPPRWGWPEPPNVQPHGPKLPQLSSFWQNKPSDWFTLAESTFNRHGIADRRLRFDLVLPALQDEVREQLGSVLAAVDDVQDPYRLLKQRLLDIFTPDPFDLVYSLLNGAALGDRKPSSLMEIMLASLPPGEVDGLVFKGMFLTRLPDSIRALVQTQARLLDSRPLAAYADQLWIAHHAKPAGRPVMAVTSAAGEAVDEDEDLEGAVAALALSRQPRKKPAAKKRRGGGGGGSQPAAGREKAKWLCYRHQQFRERAYRCDDPERCSWSGNEKAGE